MQQFPITLNDADQRLDKFLKKLFPGATLSFLYKLNRKWNIKVIIDKKKTKQSNEYQLQIGDTVQVFLSDIDIEKITKVERDKKIEISEKFSQKKIVYEDNHLLIVNKSSGQNVHPADHKSTETSLIEQVQDYLWESFSSLTFKPSLIHRIDRDTSGIIMIAKDKKALTQLSADFKKKSISLTPSPSSKEWGEQWGIQKTYFSIVFGKLSRSSGTIKKNLLRVENAKNENKVQISETWQEAISHYKLWDEYVVKTPQGEQVISSVQVTIETGRMHQIRVHMAHIGNPIVWDKTYGNKSLNGYFAKNFWVTRHMLHAWKIGFTHPITGKKMNLEAKLKKDMMGFLEKIKR